MHVTEIIKGKIFAAGSKVSLAVPVGLQNTVDDSDHYVVSNVKLPAMIEQRVR